MDRLASRVPRASRLTLSRRERRERKSRTALSLHLTTLQTHDRKVMPLKLALITDTVLEREEEGTEEETLAKGCEYDQKGQVAVRIMYFGKRKRRRVS